MPSACRSNSSPYLCDSRPETGDSDCATLTQMAELDLPLSTDAGPSANGKVRLSGAGLHYFDRSTGLNVLLEDVAVPEQRWATAPRFVSIALTNACELRCSYCYAPKHSATLEYSEVVRWAVELDEGGCLGVGFGGGEPTAHPRFAELCQAIAARTGLAVTFTTHGHRLTPELAGRLRGSVHFIRISVDGVGATYEALRGRPFRSVERAAAIARSIAPIGINVVVNSDTIGDLDDVVAFAASARAQEVLLLPEQPTGARGGLVGDERERLTSWIGRARTPMRLAIARSGLEAQVPTADPFPGEDPLQAHLHIDASGSARPDAYSQPAVAIDGSVLDAVEVLRRTA